MPQGTRDKARSRSRSTPEKPTPSCDCTSSEPARAGGNTAVLRFRRIDALLLPLLIGFALLLIIRTGFAAGQQLWPMPDAVEYAALAVNLDRGLGPVLHFGGNTYPSRYTIGYPLMLAAAYPILGRRPERLCLVTALTALIAIAGLYVLTLAMFDRPSAILAGLLMATSPRFLASSTYVMSDVPSLAVVVLVVLAFLYAEEKQSRAASALCGLLAGLAVTIRVTNGVVLIGILAAVLLVRPRKLQLARVTAFVLGFIALPGLQASVNLHYLGSPLSSGYAFWLPEDFNSVFRTFSLRSLFVPNGTAFRQGNLVTYVIVMLGLDGILGRLILTTELRTLVHAHYAFYPFPVAVFAGLGVFFALRRERNPRTMRAVYLGVEFLASLLLIYLAYLAADPRYLIPGLFIVFATSGYGLVCANRGLKMGWKGFAVIALDAVLAGAIAVQTVSRIAMPLPQESKLVADVLAIRPQLRNAVVVSDISLQWLQLIAGGEGTEFVGLNDLYSGEVQSVTEYHLQLLSRKKSEGWSGLVPRILFPGGELDQTQARWLADQDKRGRSVYALITKPQTLEWQNILELEAAEIDRYFTNVTIADYPDVGLYRLTPH